MWPVVGITAVVLVLMALLLNLNVRTRWPWPVKAVATVVAFASLGGAYFSVKGLLGWPVRGAMPEGLQVLAIEVVEPAKTHRASGAIYVWARSADPQQRPRAYAFPYTQDMHQAAAQAQDRLRAGRRQGIRFAPPGELGGGRTPSPSFYDLKRQLDDKTGGATR